jgi:hypothetical protein
MNQWTELADREERFRKALEKIAKQCDFTCSKCSFWLSCCSSMVGIAREALKEDNEETKG